MPLQLYIDQIDTFSNQTAEPTTLYSGTHKDLTYIIIMKDRALQ